MTSTGESLHWTYNVLEKNVIPDWLVRRQIRNLLYQRLLEKPTSYSALVEYKQKFYDDLRTKPIALSVDEANQQHYEVPTEFYHMCLGVCKKYSGCWYGYTDKNGRDPQIKSLNDAEEAMLKIYSQRAQLKDGQKILDLGCGWGSFTLWAAGRFPNSAITSVSNSRTQKEYIDSEAAKRGYKNIRVITQDVNDLDVKEKFDRIVSVEMFEHCKNYEILLRKLSTMLVDNGLLFIHIFTHKDFPYHFEVKSPSDWMAKYFFTNGTMPSDDLLYSFQKDLSIVNHWVVNGKNYQQTCEDWLLLMDSNTNKIRPLFTEAYGQGQETKWIVRWRLFYLACAELFGYNNGEEWMVSHYLFQKK
eukprot:TRINITY_DN3751_c0_g1_i1.p1 TRINITY_DN3751_c0_g1~~TRINITY_DN3751_c0_g1_i1.p1  ORF type:complete len:374 (+),score=57.67 TRINITY_DN3751_c0_g1_i1:50-1123(+)